MLLSDGQVERTLPLDIAYLVGYAFIVAGIASFPIRRVSGREGWQVLSEIALIALTIMFLGANLLIRARLAYPGATTVEHVVLYLYPVFDAVLGGGR